MTTLSQGKVAGQFLLSEANFHRSRDNVTILAGSGKLSAGTVLGKITASGKFTTTNLAAADGSETADGILLYNVDASGGADVPAVIIARDAEVKGDELVYHASVDQAAEKAAKKAELAGFGVIVR